MARAQRQRGGRKPDSGSAGGVSGLTLVAGAVLLLSAGAILGSFSASDEPPPPALPPTAGADQDLEQLVLPAPSADPPRSAAPRQREFGLPVAPDTFGAEPAAPSAAIQPSKSSSSVANSPAPAAPAPARRETESGPAPDREPSPVDSARWAQAIGASVVRVLVVTPDGTREGSGFVIGPNHVATAARVVEGALRLTVIIPRGRRITAEVGRADRLRDVALLYCGAGLPPAVALGDSDELRQNDRLGVLGFASGLAPSPGRSAAPASAQARLVAVRQRRIAGSAPELELDRVVQAEMAGGPVFLLSTGSVVGVAAPVTSEEGDIGGAVPISALRALLAR